MLASDFYHSEALNFFQITKMLLFPDQIAKMLTLSEKYRAYSRSTLYMLICITRMLLFYLYRPNTYSWSLSLRSLDLIYQCQLGWFCAEQCLYCAIHLVHYSWVPGHGIVPVHIKNYSPVNSSMTCAMKSNSWNSLKYLITFYIVSWVIRCDINIIFISLYYITVYYSNYYIKSNEVFFAISWIVFHCACRRTLDRWLGLDMDRYYTMVWYPVLVI